MSRCHDRNSCHSGVTMSVGEVSQKRFWGAFLAGYSDLCNRTLPAAAVSTTQLSDPAIVARQFSMVRAPSATR